MTDYNETSTEQSSTGDKPGSGKQVQIDTTSMDRLEKALLPYEKQLQKQVMQFMYMKNIRLSDYLSLVEKE